MAVPLELPVRLASSSGEVLFRAPRSEAANLGGRRDRFFEYEDGLKLTAAQQPGVWHRDDHWIASRPMSDAEKQRFLKELEEDNREVLEMLRTGAGG